MKSLMTVMTHANYIFSRAFNKQYFVVLIVMTTFSVSLTCYTSWIIRKSFMSNSVIEYKASDGVANICLSRPKQYNSLNGELRKNFLQILDEVENDISIRVVIISGAGPGFCAGADLIETTAEDIPIQLENEYKPIFEKIVNGKKIFIAAVHGSAAGIGSTLALACDFLVMSKNSKLSFVFSNIGLIPDGGAHWLLAQKLGYNKALEFIINGEHVSAIELSLIHI